MGMTIKTELDLGDYHDGDSEYEGETLEQAIISSIVTEAKSKLNIKETVDKIIEEQMDMSIKDAIGKWAENLIENYLDKEIVVTDKYGESDFEGTVRQRINKQFEDVWEQKVDKNLKKTNQYDGKPRFERMVENIVSEYSVKFVKDTEKEVTEAVKQQLNGDLKIAIGKGVIENIGISKIIDGMRQIGNDQKA